uniref:Small ribosomal subunit protein mS26 n=1 Tax=Trichuris muris TaxID=70415 RepID=A0A5S6QTS8_TRIMR
MRCQRTAVVAYNLYMRARVRLEEEKRMDRLFSRACILCLGRLQARQMSRRVPKPGKPPNLPLAKTKRYRVMHIPWQDPAEVKEMLWRRHVYNCAVKSIREYYRQCIAGKQTESLASASYHDEIEQEFKMLLEENDALNKKQADKREAESVEKRRRMEEEIVAMVEKHVQQSSVELEKREKEVLEWIERSKDFVTLDNMDEMIERALESPVDFNFAMDVHGRMFKGKPLVKYNTENLLLTKPVSEETVARIPFGRLKDLSDESTQQTFTN